MQPIRTSLLLAALLLAPAGGILTGCAAPDHAPEGAAHDAGATSDDAIALSGDGWVLHADWRAPAGTCRPPAVLLLHKAAGSRAEQAALAESLRVRGVASLALDLRGHGESVNLGRFEPPYEENLHINEGAHRDIALALRWLRANGQVDGARLAVLGASYSGEAAAIAFREGARANAYVMMSPGSFSDTSITMLGDSGAAWLFVRTSEEGQASKGFIDAIHEALSERAPAAEQKIYPGEGHATRILTTHPESVPDIAEWLAEKLGAGDC